jgi:hypothetical protein
LESTAGNIKLGVLVAGLSVASFTSKKSSQEVAIKREKHNMAAIFFIIITFIRLPFQITIKTLF